MSVVRTLWRVAVDLVIGDDPKIAVAVMLSLTLSGALLTWNAAPVPAVMVAGATLLAIAFAFSLHLDTRHAARRGSTRLFR